LWQEIKEHEVSAGTAGNDRADSLIDPQVPERPIAPVAAGTEAPVTG
jgi:hypothetical protein